MASGDHVTCIDPETLVCLKSVIKITRFRSGKILLFPMSSNCENVSRYSINLKILNVVGSIWSQISSFNYETIYLTVIVKPRPIYVCCPSPLKLKILTSTWSILNWNILSNTVPVMALWLSLCYTCLLFSDTFISASRDALYKSRYIV